jgi:hypothetical protein
LAVFTVIIFFRHVRQNPASAFAIPTTNVSDCNSLPALSANNPERCEVSMKRILLSVFLSFSFLLFTFAAAAQPGEPTIYVIKKGDTLWGLSDRFLKDPYYWPNLWSRNQTITNPHLIYPGQRLRIYPDRIEIEPKVSEAPPASMPVYSEQVTPERTFQVVGAPGFVQDNMVTPAGSLIKTPNDHALAGEFDKVYTDIGASQGAKPGDMYSIFRNVKRVDHPVTGDFVGYKIVPVGVLRLTDLEEKSSRALVTTSYLEIGTGCFLMPYQERQREIPLKASSVDLDGYVIETRLGNELTGQNDVIYLDMGRLKGIDIGNLVYIVKDVAPDEDVLTRDVGRLPQEVYAAAVIVEALDRTSTALVIKSEEPISIGDHVRLIRN